VRPAGIRHWIYCERLRRASGDGKVGEKCRISAATIPWELWRFPKGSRCESLELPEPTFRVDTGGKSVHSYWVFTQPIPIADWGELQGDLLEYVDGDRSIKNPSRVMRLAGCWHIRVNSEYGYAGCTRNWGIFNERIRDTDFQFLPVF
jgi:hypothetical protein